MTRRILFVAMQNSPHTARWIGQIADKGWDLHLFPINHLPVLPTMRGLTIHRPLIQLHPRLIARALLRNPFTGWKTLSRLEASLHPHGLPVRSVYPLPMIDQLDRALDHFFRVRTGESEMTAPLLYGPRVLARLVRQLQPDFIHSMEFQNCSYVVLAAKQMSKGRFPPWLATNWGSDIYHYRNFNDHKAQITRLLKSIDFYSCECERDVQLSRELGFAGKVLPVLPNAGGFDLPKIARLRLLHSPAQRRIIMVKGYQHFAGRALTALTALEACAQELKDFQIFVYAASPEVIERVIELKTYVGLNIDLLPYLPHDAMLRMFSRARVYLGVSVSDAISTSMLEAMALGAFPIQTNTSCCDEWIEDSKSGFIIPPDDVELIADRIRKALSDNQLVERAADINWSTVKNRLDQNDLQAKTVEFYDDVFESIS